MGSFAAGRDTQADDAAATQALSGGRSEDSQAGSGGARARSRQLSAAPEASNGSMLGSRAHGHIGAGASTRHAAGGSGGSGGGPSRGSGSSGESGGNGAGSPMKEVQESAPSSSHRGAGAGKDAHANGTAASGATRLPPREGTDDAIESQEQGQSKKRKRPLTPSLEVRAPAIIPVPNSLHDTSYRCFVRCLGAIPPISGGRVSDVCLLFPLCCLPMSKIQGLGGNCAC